LRATGYQVPSVAALSGIGHEPPCGRDPGAGRQPADALDEFEVTGRKPTSRSARTAAPQQKNLSARQGVAVDHRMLRTPFPAALILELRRRMSGE